MNGSLKRLGALAIPLLFAGCAPGGDSGRPSGGRTASGAPAASTPSIAGTYRFAYRQFENGTRQQPPMVNGLMTFTDGYRNLNIMEHDARNRIVILTSVSRYSLTDSVYAEHLQYSVSATFGQNGRLAVDSNRDESVPVTTGADGSISFRELVNGLRLTFTADSMTVTMPGTFVDHWARVAHTDRAAPLRAN